MALPPYLPEASVGPARGVGPQPVGRAPANNFGAVNIGPVGRAAGFLASAAVPGLGVLNTGLNANNIMANNAARQALGQPNLNFGQVVGGLLGFNSYGRGLAPGIQSQMGSFPRSLIADAPSYSGGTTGSASQDFFGAINDLGTVGNLGSTLDAMDAQRDAGGYQGGGGHDSGLPDAAAETGGIYRQGGYIPRDGDGRLEPVNITAHEGEYVIRPEAVDKIGLKNLEALNAGSMPRVLAKLLREGK